MTKLLHNIGVSPSNQAHIRANYNTREEVLACTEPLSFDGIYLNVYENRDVLKGKDVTLFVMGHYIGGDNSFDHGMPHEKYCTMEQLLELKAMGCKLGWHTWFHHDLTSLNDIDILKEMTAPPEFRETFAYPYGRFDERCKAIAESLGYKEAWSVTQGDGTQFAKVRTYL